MFSCGGGGQNFGKGAAIAGVDNLVPAVMLSSSEISRIMRKSKGSPHVDDMICMCTSQDLQKLHLAVILMMLEGIGQKISS